MSDVRVELKSVEVVKGQGIGKGNLELNVKVQEGRNQVHWPDPFPATHTVDQGGAIIGIGKRIGTYAIASGARSKLYSIRITEKDKGTLGQDDIGYGDVTIELKPNMKPITKSATIDLKPANQKKKNGKAKVTLSAEVI